MLFETRCLKISQGQVINAKEVFLNIKLAVEQNGFKNA